MSRNEAVSTPFPLHHDSPAGRVTIMATATAMLTAMAPRCRRCASPRRPPLRPPRAVAGRCRRSAPMSTAGTRPAGTSQQRFVHMAAPSAPKATDTPPPEDAHLQGELALPRLVALYPQPPSLLEGADNVAQEPLRHVRERLRGQHTALPQAQLD